MASADRTARDYAQEAERFLERIIEKVGNEAIVALGDEADWLTFVQDFLMGESGKELTANQESFFLDARDTLNAAFEDAHLMFDTRENPLTGGPLGFRVGGRFATSEQFFQAARTELDTRVFPS